MPKQYDKYKNSNVIWFGEIPHEWSLAKLAWCVNFINGYSFDSELMDIDKEIPVIRIGDIQNNKVNYETCLKVSINEKNLSLYEIRNNDILIAMSGATTGKLAIISSNTKAYINQRVGIIRTRFNRFIRYCLDNESFIQYINLLSAGSAQPNISRGNILDYKIPYIKFAEQQQIADYLDKKCTEIDRIVETQKNIIEKLKEYKQAVITEAVTKGLDKSVPLKDSGIKWIGEIPEQWEVKKLKQLISKPLQYGANESGVIYNENYPRYIRITDIKENNSLKDDGKLSLLPQNAQDYILENDDILFARSGATVGKTFIYKTEYGLSAFAGYLIRACLKVEINASYIYYFTLSSAYEKWKDRIFIQATIQNIGANKYNNMEIVLPQKTIQDFIVDYLDKKCSEIDTAISEKEQLIEKLIEYKKSLIYECVTGKRRSNYV